MVTDPVDADLAGLVTQGVDCRAWPEQERGPYHRPAPPVRRDVVDDRVGVPLRLAIQVLGRDDQVRPDALVDIWHCDASGRYSGFPPPEPGRVVTTETAPREASAPEHMFLRGQQPTDEAGMVAFHTIYPGWYPGRTVHIHAIVETGGAVFTTQLYFPEPVTAEVFATPPYRTHPGRDTFNDTDEIFPGPVAPVLDVRPDASGLHAAVCFTLPVG